MPKVLESCTVECGLEIIFELMFVTGAMLDYILVLPTVAKRNVDTPVTSDLRRNSNKLYLLNIIS